MPAPVSVGGIFLQATSNASTFSARGKGCTSTLARATHDGREIYETCKTITETATILTSK